MTETESLKRPLELLKAVLDIPPETPSNMAICYAIKWINKQQMLQPHLSKFIEAIANSLGEFDKGLRECESMNATAQSSEASSLPVSQEQTSSPGSSPS